MELRGAFSFIAEGGGNQFIPQIRRVKSDPLPQTFDQGFIGRADSNAKAIPSSGQTGVSNRQQGANFSSEHTKFTHFPITSNTL
jgi:hypothetical protein